jgi:hypothetical protein
VCGGRKEPEAGRENRQHATTRCHESNPRRPNLSVGIWWNLGAKL